MWRVSNISQPGRFERVILSASFSVLYVYVCEGDMHVYYVNAERGRKFARVHAFMCIYEYHCASDYRRVFDFQCGGWDTSFDWGTRRSSIAAIGSGTVFAVITKAAVTAYRAVRTGTRAAIAHTAAWVIIQQTAVVQTVWPLVSGCGGVVTAIVVKRRQRLVLCLNCACASYEHERVGCFHFVIFAWVCGRALRTTLHIQESISREPRSCPYPAWAHFGALSAPTAHSRKMGWVRVGVNKC